MKPNENLQPVDLQALAQRNEGGPITFADIQAANKKNLSLAKNTHFSDIISSGIRGSMIKPVELDITRQTLQRLNPGIDPDALLHAIMSSYRTAGSTSQISGGAMASGERGTVLSASTALNQTTLKQKLVDILNNSMRNADEVTRDSISRRPDDDQEVQSAMIVELYKQLQRRVAELSSEEEAAKCTVPDGQCIEQLSPTAVQNFINSEVTSQIHRLATLRTTHRELQSVSKQMTDISAKLARQSLATPGSRTTPSPRSSKLLRDTETTIDNDEEAFHLSEPAKQFSTSSSAPRSGECGRSLDEEFSAECSSDDEAFPSEKQLFDQAVIQAMKNLQKAGVPAERLSGASVQVPAVVMKALGVACGPPEGSICRRPKSTDNPNNDSASGEGDRQTRVDHDRRDEHDPRFCAVTHKHVGDLEIMMDNARGSSGEESRRVVEVIEIFSDPVVRVLPEFLTAEECDTFIRTACDSLVPRGMYSDEVGRACDPICE